MIDVNTLSGMSREKLIDQYFSLGKQAIELKQAGNRTEGTKLSWDKASILQELRTRSGGMSTIVDGANKGKTVWINPIKSTAPTSTSSPLASSSSNGTSSYLSSSVSTAKNNAGLIIIVAGLLLLALYFLGGKKWKI